MTDVDYLLKSELSEFAPKQRLHSHESDPSSPAARHSLLHILSTFVRKSDLGPADVRTFCCDRSPNLIILSPVTTAINPPLVKISDDALL